MRVLCAAVVLGLLVMGGCATIMTGTTQPITVNSEPAGATVTVAGNRLITPGTIELSRKRDATVVVEKEGYKSQQIVLKRKLEGWAFGNILIGGLVGVIVDSISGGLMKFKQDTLFFDLQPVDAKPKVMSRSDSGKPPPANPTQRRWRSWVMVI